MTHPREDHGEALLVCGFDDFFAGELNRYWANYSLENRMIDTTGEWVNDDRFRVDIQTDAAVTFIENHADDDEPFFLYVAHECPHFPFQGPDDEEKVINEENWMESDPQTYVAMLEDLDSEVGRLLKAVDSAGVANNTVVVFASDNGGFGPAAHMGGLRGSKGTTFEGGIRVPLIIRWPGRIKPDTESNQVCATFDLTRSFLSLADADVADDRLEGDDIIEHVVSEKADYPRTLFWRGKRGDRVWSAVRDGDRKYVRKVEGDQTEEFLFDLSRDRNEAASLMSTDDASHLMGLLSDWEKDVQPVR